MKNVRIIIAVALCSGIMGCGNKGGEGVYVNSRNPKSYLELKPDGSYSLKEPGNQMTGKYEPEEESIAFVTSAGSTTTCQLKGDTLIGEDQELWILWHGGKTGREYEERNKAVGGFGGQVISSIKDNIIADLSNLAADAYQYKIRPVGMGGGGGSYAGYAIGGSWGPGNPNAVYNVTTETASELVLTAASKLVSGATITISYNGDGTVTSGPTADGF